MLKLLSCYIIVFMDIRVIIRIDELIRRQRTGNPRDLAYHLSLSERIVYNYLSFMKTELNAPIKYNNHKQSYYYTCETPFCFVMRNYDKNYIKTEFNIS